MSERGQRARETARALFERRPDPYEGADLGTSRRVTAALLVLSAVLTAAFLPLDPPTQTLDAGGWALAALLLVVSVAAVPLVLDPQRGVGFDALLVIAYWGVLQVALLERLAGPGSSYGVLFVLWLAAGAIHPPRRAFVHLVFLLAALCLPLAYHGADGELARRIVADGLLILAVDSLLIAYLFHVRRQRAGLREGAEVARRLAGTDPLTGLGNRRAFDEALTAAIATARRERTTLSVGLLDLENLKRINDRFGHLEGDHCLQEAAREMEARLRDSDRCFRWGGDEFAVLLPGTEQERAARILERVVADVGRVCEQSNGVGVRLSFGVTQHEPGRDAEDVLAAADLDLMERKTERRR